MGWMKSLLICSFLVSVYLPTQAECGYVVAASAESDDKHPAFGAIRALFRQKRDIKDCSDLQKNLNEMKVKCNDSYSGAMLNIKGLKKQLHDLFKYVKNNNCVAKDVLKFLQKFIDLQEIQVLKVTEKDAAAIKRLEKRQEEIKKDLRNLKEKFSGVTKMIKHAVSRRSAETLNIDKATATALNEFKKYLDDKVKQPGEKGDIAKQVMKIVLQQIEALELQTRLSDKYTVQAQIDASTSKLDYKNGLLLDLKEELQDRPQKKQKIGELITAVEKEISDLNSELSALKQTLAQLNEKSKEYDRKKTEIMDKIAELKGKDELISRIHTLQFGFMEALITARGQMNANEFETTELQKKLVKQQEKGLYLYAQNEDLRKQLFDEKEQCKDLMNVYLDTEAQLEGAINQIADSTSKTAVQIILQGIEIDGLTKQIKASPNDDLKRLRDEKLKELKAKKEELKKKDANAEKLLKVISQMEDIWKLQNDDPESLKQISDMQKNLLKLIKELDDNMAVKPMLQNMALQSDVTWIREMLKKVTAQAETQKNELQKELNKKEILLNEKNKQLAAATGEISKLEKEIATLKGEISTLKTQIRTAEDIAKKRIKELEEKLQLSDKALNDANSLLKEKDAKLAQQVANVSDLINEVRSLKEQMQSTESQLKSRIGDLERKIVKKQEENEKLLDENKKLTQECKSAALCSELEEKHKKLVAEYNQTIDQLQSENLKKFFMIKSLIEEVTYLDKQSAQGFQVKEELEEKTRQLEEAKQKLKAQGSISVKTLEVLELLAEIWKLQENPTETNLVKIQKLEAQLNGTLTELQNSGEKGLGLSLKVVSLKESMSRLKHAQAQMEDKYKTEINDLKKKIDDKDKEIGMLKASCTLTDQLSKRIKQLEKEAEENKLKMKQLQQESENKIASLQKIIQTKNQQLENSEEKLKEANAKTADLIKKLNDKDDEIQQITEQQNNALQKAEKDIASLKDRLQKTEDTLAKQDKFMKEKDENIAALIKQLDNKKNELDKVKDNNQKLEKELKTKDQQLVNAEAKVKDLEAKNEDLNRTQNKLDKDLKKITEEKNTLQATVSDLKNTVEEQKQELAKKDKKIQEKDKEVDSLKKDNNNVKTELQKEQNKNNDLIKEKEQLKQELNETISKLEEQEKKPEGEWPEFDAKTAHRRLLLSVDEKEARTSLLGQAVADTPQRYDTAIAVLGKKGFDSGKHYWEIGVQGRNCFVVGAVKESADRKGILKYGPSSGYWVIMMKRDGKLTAIDDTQVKLSGDSPSAIGVQLDFKNNEVTFYNAEQKYKIYKFTGRKLQEKMYPYVETCSDFNFSDPPVIIKKPQSFDWIKQ